MVQGSYADYPRRGSRMSTGFSRLYVFVCLFACFQHDIPKPMPLGSPNLSQACNTVTPGNSLILCLKVKGQGPIAGVGHALL